MATKLNDIFNACAGKVVDLVELGTLGLAALQARLTEKELQLYSAVQQAGLDVTTPAIDAFMQDADSRAKMIDAIGDGTCGIYMDDEGRVLVNINQLKFMAEQKGLVVEYPAEISDKASDCLADAIEKAKDYRTAKRTALNL